MQLPLYCLVHLQIILHSPTSSPEQEAYHRIMLENKLFRDFHLSLLLTVGISLTPFWERGATERAGKRVRGWQNCLKDIAEETEWKSDLERERWWQGGSRNGEASLAWLPLIPLDSSKAISCTWTDRPGKWWQLDLAISCTALWLYCQFWWAQCLFQARELSDTPWFTAWSQGSGWGCARSSHHVWGAPVPSHTVMPWHSERHYVLVKTKLEYSFWNTLLFGKGKNCWKGCQMYKSSMSHVLGSNSVTGVSCSWWDQSQTDEVLLPQICPKRLCQE